MGWESTRPRSSAFSQPMNPSCAFQLCSTSPRTVTMADKSPRRVTPGMVFVAIPGQHTDGHEFIDTAIERGATAIICEHNGFLSHRATSIKVADAREALARAAMTYYQHPSAKLKVIGVTGTN